MKQVLLQFPSLSNLTDYIEAFDVSNCKVSQEFFNILGELDLEDIRMAEQLFEATVIDLNY